MFWFEINGILCATFFPFQMDADTCDFFEKLEKVLFFLVMA